MENTPEEEEEEEEDDADDEREKTEDLVNLSPEEIGFRVEASNKTPVR
jgi:hypothetical protein